MIHFLVILPILAIVFFALMLRFQRPSSGELAVRYVTRITSMAFVVLLMQLVMLSICWWQAGFDGASQRLQLLGSSPDWLWESRYSWIPSLGVSWYLAVDGLSLICLTVTFVLAGVGLVLYRRQQLASQANRAMILVPSLVMLMVTSSTVVMLAMDVFLMAVAWCVLMWAYYGLWVHVKTIEDGYSYREKSDNQPADAVSASVFLFLSQFAGLLMLIAIIILAVFHFNQTQELGFAYIDLISTVLPKGWSSFVMVFFCFSVLAFFPVCILHLWQMGAQRLPKFVMQLALILLMTSVYVLWRFVFPLFPEASSSQAYYLRVLALFTMGYAAVLAFSKASMSDQSMFDKDSGANGESKASAMMFNPASFFSYIAMFHAGVVLFAIYLGTLISWQSALLYLVSALMGLAGLYVLHGMVIAKTVAQARSHRSVVSLPYVTQFTLLFFAAVAAGFPLFGALVAEFQLLTSTLVAYPKQAAALMVAFLLLFVAMGRYVFSMLSILSDQGHKRGVLSSKQDAKTNDSNLQPRFRLEWVVLMLLAMVTLKVGFIPQKLMDTSYESFRWIHHVYSKPHELHPVSMSVPQQKSKSLPKHHEVAP